MEEMSGMKEPLGRKEGRLGWRSHEEGGHQGGAPGTEETPVMEEPLGREFAGKAAGEGVCCEGVCWEGRRGARRAIGEEGGRGA